MVLPVSCNSSSQGWGLVGEEKAPLPYTGDMKPNGAPNVPQSIPLKKLAAFLRLQLLRTLVAEFVGNVVWGMQRQQFFALQANWALHLGYR